MSDLATAEKIFGMFGMSDVPGTYLKVVRFPEPLNPDGLIVLYLRPNGRFLFVGYWRGYERSAAAGCWVREGKELRLVGRGRPSTDTIPGPEGGRFDRVFEMEIAHHTPCLTSAEELKGWSLLSWTGPFMYVGQHTIIDPDGCWLPASVSAVDASITELVGA